MLLPEHCIQIHAILPRSESTKTDRSTSICILMILCKLGAYIYGKWWRKSNFYSSLVIIQHEPRTNALNYMAKLHDHPDYSMCRYLPIKVYRNPVKPSLIRSPSNTKLWKVLQSNRMLLLFLRPSKPERAQGTESWRVIAYHKKCSSCLPGGQDPLHLL